MAYNAIMKYNENGFSIVKLIAVVVLILAGAGAVYAMYAWQQTKVSDLNDQVSSLNTKVSSLQAQLGAQCQSTAPQTSLPCPSYGVSSGKKVAAVVYSPTAQQKVTSPLAVIGKIPGNWSFEAQFPVELKDSKGVIVAKGAATVLGNWQTSELVPFSAQLIYSGTPSGTGTLVLKKDNPSGMPQNDDSIVVPVRF